MERWTQQTIIKSSTRKSRWINTGSSVTRCFLGWRARWITKACNRNRQTLPAVTAANCVQPCWNICSVLFHKLTASPVTFYQDVEPIRNFTLHAVMMMMMMMQMAPSRTSWIQQQVLWGPSSDHTNTSAVTAQSASQSSAPGAKQQTVTPAVDPSVQQSSEKDGF